MAENQNQTAQLKFQKDHNIIAFLDVDHAKAENHIPIINYLKSHRLRHALTIEAGIVESHIRGFWNTAQVIK